LNGGLHAVSIRKPSEPMSNFWTVWFLKPNFDFPHIPINEIRIIILILSSSSSSRHQSSSVDQSVRNIPVFSCLLKLPFILSYGILWVITHSAIFHCYSSWLCFNIWPIHRCLHCHVARIKYFPLLTFVGTFFVYWTYTGQPDRLKWR